MADRPLVKCLVWDLDNTLWQGTLLEDGEVRLSDAVRKTVVELDARGVLQSVASRNDHDHAWATLEKLGVAEYFVLPRIHWGAKSHSVREIAEELNFALSTIAFIDDMPTERAEVAHHLPEVRCFDAAQAEELLHLPDFSPQVVTVDARRRREMYQAGFRRDAERAGFEGPDEDFLRTLELVMRIGKAKEAELSRVEELTLRTSQMNATGIHYSDEALRALVSDPDHEVLVISLADRFGPHGAVGVMLVERGAAAWRLKLLATSCRVVSFGAGAVLLRWLVDQAARAGVHLVADFRRTDRNRMMEVAYRFAGFAPAGCECLAGFDTTGADAGTVGIERLHLVPGSQQAPTTMAVFAPELHRRGEAPVEWSST
ncbi:HAD-IIIC family phosphatase [Saccharothrix australiensis]|uniref:Methoxymalonate biosynthesis protein n=1 Tax=Saccharothrix australiensis TaxID=2072 RepID=A0A495VXD2_9PSEU|nr:HAD-IIIC family phosphatase [Saccharothrix australiensis]RKT53854.1 methoxymalonate biosynthesis protein [Saccharothrix australiensis]